MANKTVTNIRTDNAAVAPVGTEPIETVQSSTSAAFVFSELSNHPLNAQTGTAYTLVLTDQGKAVTMSNAAANILTIPLNASVAFHIGTLLLVRQIGAGGTTVVGDGGVTVELDANASLVMDGAQQQILLHKTATDTWHAAPVATGSGSGSGARVISTTTLSVDAATIPITLSNLTEFDFEISYPATSPAPSGVALFINGNTTDSNYQSRGVDCATGIAAFTGANPNVGGLDATKASHTRGTCRVIDGRVIVKTYHQLGETKFAIRSSFFDIATTDITTFTVSGRGTDLASGTTVVITDPFAGGGTQSTVTFHGALVEEESSTARTASGFTATFDVEDYDTDGFADLGTDDDRLTIPAGVTKVRVSGIIDAENIAVGSDNWMSVLHYNSADALQRIYGNTQQNGITTAFDTLHTPVIAVAEGDYFQLQAASTDSSWNQLYAALSIEYKDGSLIDAPQQIVDLSTFIQGAPGDAEKLMTFVVTTAFTFPSGLATSAAYAEVTGASAATIDIIKNGAAASGTINFASGTNAATFTLASDLVFAVGDRLQLVNQGTADSTLADISITLRGNL